MRIHELQTKDKLTGDEQKELEALAQAYEHDLNMVSAKHGLVPCAVLRSTDSGIFPVLVHKLTEEHKEKETEDDKSKS